MDEHAEDRRIDEELFLQNLSLEEERRQLPLWERVKFAWISFKWLWLGIPKMKDTVKTMVWQGRPTPDSVEGIDSGSVYGEIVAGPLKGSFISFEICREMEVKGYPEFNLLCSFSDTDFKRGSDGRSHAFIRAWIYDPIYERLLQTQIPCQLRFEVLEWNFIRPGHVDYTMKRVEIVDLVGPEFTFVNELPF